MKSNALPFIQIGVISKAQGLKGEVKVLLSDEFPLDIEALDLVYIRNQRGDLQPQRIQHLRVEEKANQQSFFVQFDGIADRASAEQLRNKTLFIDESQIEQVLVEEEEVVDVIDFNVMDNHNEEIGYVYDIMENPAHPILEVATTKGSLLIPFVDEFVVQVDTERQIIRCKNLNQLRDTDASD
ncbi:MAG: ribosome maturation factor RimM [Bacteroidota bacterium]